MWCFVPPTIGAVVSLSLFFFIYFFPPPASAVVFPDQLGTNCCCSLPANLTQRHGFDQRARMSGFSLDQGEGRDERADSSGTVQKKQLREKPASKEEAVLPEEERGGGGKGAPGAPCGHGEVWAPQGQGQQR